MSEVQSTVEYREIQGFQGYRVGNDGSVWSSRLGEWKKCSLYRRPYGNRYLVVCLRNIGVSGTTTTGKVHCRYVHRLVLEAFVGPCPKGMECRHFPDRDTSNNSAGNLSWATHAQNIADKEVHGTDINGESHHLAIHSQEQIKSIHNLRASGKSQEEIGREVGMSQSEVGDVLRGDRWAKTTKRLREDGEIPRETKRFHLNCKISDLQVQEIRDKAAKGETPKSLAKYYKLSYCMVNDIIAFRRRNKTGVVSPLGGDNEPVS